MRPVGRPNLLLELLLIQLCYGIYSYIRNAAPNRRASAVQNAEQLQHLEQLLHVDAEGAVNRLARGNAWLMDLMLDHYHVLHFAVPLAVLSGSTRAGPCTTAPAVRACSSPPGWPWPATGGFRSLSRRREGAPEACRHCPCGW